MTGCLKVAYSKIAVIINAVTLGYVMWPHRIAHRSIKYTKFGMFLSYF